MPLTPDYRETVMGHVGHDEQDRTRHLDDQVPPSVLIRILI